MRVAGAKAHYGLMLARLIQPGPLGVKGGLAIMLAWASLGRSLVYLSPMRVILCILNGSCLWASGQLISNALPLRPPQLQLHKHLACWPRYPSVADGGPATVLHDIFAERLYLCHGWPRRFHSANLPSPVSDDMVGVYLLNGKYCATQKRTPLWFAEHWGFPAPWAVVRKVVVEVFRGKTCRDGNSAWGRSPNEC